MAARSSASASAGGLSEPDAVAAVGGDPVEHGRRPLPSPDDADDRRVRQAERGHQRIRLGLVAARLVGLERPAEHEQLVEGRDALAPLRCVGRPARDGQPERDRAGMGDDDIEVGRLRDDREVAGRAGPDRRQRSLPAVLLGRHERHEQLPVEPGEVPARAERPDRGRGSTPRRPSCRRRRGRRPPHRGSRRPTDRPSRWPDRPAARRRGDPTGSRAAHRVARPAR